MSLRGVRNNFQAKFKFHTLMTEPLYAVETLSDKRVPEQTSDIPVKEEQYRQHGLVNVAVAVADPLVEQEAGVPHHRFQGVLPHDVVQLVRVQVLVHQLVAELAEVADTWAGGAHRQAPTEARSRTAGHGVITAIGQVQAAAATVQADGRAAVIV